MASVVPKGSAHEVLTHARVMRYGRGLKQELHVSTIVEGVHKPLPVLRRLLQLDGNDVIHEGALACVRLLETLRGTLKTLSLTSNQLDDQAVLALIDASEKYDVRVLFNVGGADDFEWREGCTAFRESLAALNGRSLPGKRALSSAPPNEVLRANFCARTACPDTPISYENSDLFLNRNSS